MKKRHRRAEEWEARIGTTSFNPLLVMELQDAVRKRAKEVTLDNQKFLLTYYTVQDREKVYYRPAGLTFAPSGHLDIKRLLEE